MSTHTYTKKDLTRMVAQKTSLSLKESTEAVNGIFESIRELLTQDIRRIRLEVRNFGVFDVKPTKAKPRARNPKTNEEIYVPAHKKIHFKPGKILKAYLSKPL